MPGTDILTDVGIVAGLSGVMKLIKGKSARPSLSHVTRTENAGAGCEYVLLGEPPCRDQGKKNLRI